MQIRLSGAGNLKGGGGEGVGWTESAWNWWPQAGVQGSGRGWINGSGSTVSIRKSRKLGGRGNSRFPCVNPVTETSADKASHLKFHQTSSTELLC